MKTTLSLVIATLLSVPIATSAVVDDTPEGDEAAPAPQLGDRLKREVRTRAA